MSDRCFVLGGSLGHAVSQVQAGNSATLRCSCGWCSRTLRARSELALIAAVRREFNDHLRIASKSGIPTTMLDLYTFWFGLQEAYGHWVARGRYGIGADGKLYPVR